ncbi:MAG: hypothetical protein HQL75_00855 [Magnetococcales bacterium]|nr:hypothetical protein [Magnetococcales bacterium]
MVHSNDRETLNKLAAIEAKIIQGVDVLRLVSASGAGEGENDRCDPKIADGGHTNHRRSGGS